jgi:hypothetical protein
MGGSGGSFPSNYDPKQVDDELSVSIDETRKAEFESTVSGFLNDLLTDINSRDTDKIQKRLEEIRKHLEKEIEDGTLILNFGGSVKKHTYVDGLSDIDSLVVLNNTELADKSPKQVQTFFLNKLKDSIKNINSIEKGNMAVTVEFKDGMVIQLLPSIRTKTGIKIPSTNGSDWSDIINPAKFAQKLSSVNSALNRKVVPAIKLIKSLNSQFPEKRQMTGYHIESLAIEAFKNFTDPDPTTKKLVRRFFDIAVELVKTPIRDKTGQSIHVDGYLGPKNSDMRKGVSYQLEFMSRKMREADRISSTDLWKDIFGEL